MVFIGKLHTFFVKLYFPAVNNPINVSVTYFCRADVTLKPSNTFLMSFSEYFQTHSTGALIGPTFPPHHRLTFSVCVLPPCGDMYEQGATSIGALVVGID